MSNKYRAAFIAAVVHADRLIDELLFERSVEVPRLDYVAWLQASLAVAERRVASYAKILRGFDREYIERWEREQALLDSMGGVEAGT